jgi:hypothetical protein
MNILKMAISIYLLVLYDNHKDEFRALMPEVFEKIDILIVFE